MSRIYSPKLGASEIDAMALMVFGFVEAIVALQHNYNERTNGSTRLLHEMKCRSELRR